MTKVRTRFAPSPTGYMHIGNLRTALYAYLVAKKDNGDFILRIEDTDQGRLVEGATDIIYSTLKECGLKHDEGPDNGGNFGPYIQSERMKQGIYMDHAKKLVDIGAAHYCFCDENEIQEQKVIAKAKGQSFIFIDPCKKLSKEDIQKRIDAGEAYVIRQTIDPNGKTSFDDEVYGTITADNETLDEMILLKSDGYPTYNFANVVDDHLMGITDVVRGNEYLSSTPKYNLLYDAFGWQKPRYIHCPPVMKNEHEKLSKRNGDASFQDLVAKGFLPEAILNYIALLGWAPSEDKEVYTLEELCKAFDVKRIGTSGAIFDIEKLKWMNGVYLRNMEFDKFYSMVKPIITKVVDSKYNPEDIAHALKERIQTINEAEDMIGFFNKIEDYSNDLFTNKKAKTNPQIAKSSLENALKVISSVDKFDNDTIFNALNEEAKNLGIKNITLMYPIQVALSGKDKTPGGATMIAQILGKEETIKRINEAINKLQ